MMNQTQNKGFQPRLSVKQTVAWDYLHEDYIREILYGGAKGGGKSVFGCIYCFLRAREIIREFQIGPREHPIPVGFAGRAKGVHFENTTLETWKRIITPELYEIRGKPAEILIGDKTRNDFRVKIDTGGLDNQEIIRKFNSAEYAFFFIDQAEETRPEDISELRASLRLLINGRRVPGKGLFSANPAKCWLKDEFILNPTKDRKFVQALPGDNPWLGQWYVENLKDTYKHRPERLQAYLFGSWDALEGEDQVILDKWIQMAMSQTIHEKETKKLISCDVARYGDDETVIFYMENTDIKDEKIYGKKDTMHTANILHIMSHEHGNCAIAIDEAGVGGGVYDRLCEMGNNVIGINSAQKSNNPERYYNLRAEIWDNAATMFAEGDVQLHSVSDTLRGQLCTPTYQYRNGKILIEPKEEIKERLGRSPDHAEAYIYGLWALRYVEPERPEQKTKYKHPQEVVSVNTF